MANLYTDSTYFGQVMRGNVECFAAAANYILRDADGIPVALFTHKEYADAALVTAGEGYTLTDGPAYDASQLPQTYALPAFESIDVLDVPDATVT